MGTRVDQFIAGLPVRNVDVVQPLTDINGEGPPASYTNRDRARRFFFTRERPETARVGFGEGTTSVQGAAARVLDRQLQSARSTAAAQEDAREAVRRRIAEQRRRFAREHESALRGGDTGTNDRAGRARRAMALRAGGNEHVVRELRPAGLAPANTPRLEVPAPNYDAPAETSQNGRVLDISG